MCGQIAKQRSITKVAKLVKTLLYSTFQGNVTSQWGIDQESETRHLYLLQECLVSPGVSVLESGFLVHHSHHWLGASPDGFVSDSSSPDPEGIRVQESLLDQNVL